MTTRYHEYEEAATQCQPLQDAARSECKEVMQTAKEAREKSDALFWELVDNVAGQGSIAATAIVATCWGSLNPLACMASVWAALKTADFYQEGSDFQNMLHDYIRAEEDLFHAEDAVEECAEASATLYDKYYKCYEHFSPKVHWMDASPGMPADPPLPDE